MKFLAGLGMLISLGVMAQDAGTVPAAPDTNAPPAIETPAAAPAVTNTVVAAPAEVVAAPTNAPAAAAPEAAPAPASKPAKKAAAKKPARKAAFPELKTVPLVPGDAVVVANRVNVRGQAGIRSEVVAHLTNGEPVVVIEEIKLKRSGPEEPSAWAKIALPSKAHMWVNAAYIDATNKTVLPKKLNVRGGPGENYSVLGTLQRGDTVTELQTKNGWIEIESKTSAFAFVAAQYLSQDPAALAAAGLKVQGTQVATVTEPATVVDAGTNLPAATDLGTNEVASAGGTNETAMASAPEEPPAPRIVQREGVVMPSISIQAPSLYQLNSIDTHKLINYLYTSSTNLDLSRYKGMHIIVSGEEGLDERWRNTPVIVIRRIQVVD